MLNEEKDAPATVMKVAVPVASEEKIKEEITFLFFAKIKN